MIDPVFKPTGDLVYPGLAIIINHLVNLDDSPTSWMGFDMAVTHRDAMCSSHKCGTACCIGGHAAILYGDAEPNYRPHRDIPREHGIMDALSLLCGVPEIIAERLCYPQTACHRFDIMMKDIKREEAIEVLEHCARTGKVDWVGVLMKRRN